MVATLLGTVELTRPYHHCPAGCGGHSPRDAALRLSADRLTAGATRAVALAGAMGSFAEAAAKTLPELCGLRLGESTVGRATERAGAEVGRRLAAGETFGPAKAWGWPEDSDGETVGYVSADLTGVGMQGAGGAKADGRTAVAGMVWNPGKPGQVRYACGVTGGLAASGDPLRRQAAQVGMDAARWGVAISDGGAGIELAAGPLPPRRGGRLGLLARDAAPQRVGQGPAPGGRGGGRAGGRGGATG